MAVDTEVAEVMTAIATTLSTIPGLRTTDYAPGQISPPQAVVMVPPLDYDQGLGRRHVDLIFTVAVLTSSTLDRQGQHLLAGYCLLQGEQSVKAAIEKDRTLGGLVDDIRVSRFQPIGLEAVGDLGFFGGEFTMPCLL